MKGRRLTKTGSGQRQDKTRQDKTRHDKNLTRRGVVVFAQLLPTSIRQGGMSIGSFAARVGSVAAPWAAEIGGLLRKSTHLFAPFYSNDAIILPRQARDKSIGKALKKR